MDLEVCLPPEVIVIDMFYCIVSTTIVFIVLQEENKGRLESVSEIPCLINDEKTVSCRRDDNDVYVPFSFIHEYFEVSSCHCL